MSFQLSKLDDFSMAYGESTQWVRGPCVASQTPKSLLAVANLQKICEENVKGNYLIDRLQNLQWAKADHIFAIATVVRHLPYPTCKVGGDLPLTERMLAALDLRSRPAANAVIGVVRR